MRKFSKAISLALALFTTASFAVNIAAVPVATDDTYVDKDGLTHTWYYDSETGEAYEVITDSSTGSSKSPDRTTTTTLDDGTAIEKLKAYILKVEAARALKEGKTSVQFAKIIRPDRTEIIMLYPITSGTYKIIKETDEETLDNDMNSNIDAVANAEIKISDLVNLLPTKTGNVYDSYKNWKSMTKKDWENLKNTYTLDEARKVFGNKFSEGDLTTLIALFDEIIALYENDGINGLSNEARMLLFKKLDATISGFYSIENGGLEKLLNKHGFSVPYVDKMIDWKNLSVDEAKK